MLLSIIVPVYNAESALRRCADSIIDSDVFRAGDAELVIVVGSANSSNSVRLVEVALEYGAKAAYRIDYASEIKQEWLDGIRTVGVTSGASVPEVLVREVLDDLAAAGYGDVEEVKTAEEDLMFSLPKELRKDVAGKRDARAEDVKRAVAELGMPTVTIDALPEGHPLLAGAIALQLLTLELTHQAGTNPDLIRREQPAYKAAADVSNT